MFREWRAGSDGRADGDRTKVRAPDYAPRSVECLTRGDDSLVRISRMAFKSKSAEMGFLITEQPLGGPAGQSGGRSPAAP